MELLFGSRMTRYYLPTAVQQLAPRAAKWTTASGRQLYRVVGYAYITLSMRMVGYCGCDVHKCALTLYAGAYCVGPRNMRSTSGVFMSMEGPNTLFPLAAQSKKPAATCSQYARC